MSNYSYICPVCGTGIRKGEKCILVHRRNGKEIGRAEGAYDGRGGIEGNHIFGNDMTDNPNSAHELYRSTYLLEDSVARERRCFEGRPVSIGEYTLTMYQRWRAEGSPKADLLIKDGKHWNPEVVLDVVKQDWEQLEVVEPQSGVAAAHFNHRSVTNKRMAKMPISKPDPNQGAGEPRSKFMWRV